MGRVLADSILSHWSQGIDGLQASSQAFYDSVLAGLDVYKLKDVKTQRVDFRESGIFSTKREYLQVRRGPHVYHICAAPYGNTFFVSSWLGETEKGIWAWLKRQPVVGFFVRNLIKPITYFQIDTAMIFQSMVHNTVLHVVDELTKASGVRQLTEAERKPIMRDFFATH